MDFSRYQGRIDPAYRVLRNSRSGASHQCEWNSAACDIGRLRPGVSLGSHRPETALPGVPPITDEPRRYWASIGDFPRLVWHRARLHERARIFARPGNPDHLQHAAVAGSGWFVEQSVLAWSYVLNSVHRTIQSPTEYGKRERIGRSRFLKGDRTCKVRFPAALVKREVRTGAAHLQLSCGISSHLSRAASRRWGGRSRLSDRPVRRRSS